MKATYKDKKGYLRYSDSRELVHRDIAYRYIYLKNRRKYPLPFGKYVIHHKNENKLFNHSSNLQLKLKGAHNLRHGHIVKGLFYTLLGK